MVQVRKLVLAIAAASALSSGMAQALGLGEVSLKSSLDQPLVAEIELLEVRDLATGELIPSLASPEDFTRAGVDRQFLLNDLKFTPVIKANGKSFIRVTSSKPIREPYLNFLVEVLWPSGRVLREYTVLLDPPLYSPQTTAAAAPRMPVAAPMPRPVAPAVRPVIAAAPVAAASRPAVAPVAASSNKLSGKDYKTTSSDTLWEIARRVPGGSAHQTMLAIQDLNPDAFIGGNINRLKSGQVLRLPDQQQINSRSPSEAIAQVNEQTAAWREGRSIASSENRQLDATKRNVAGAAPAKTEGKDSLQLVSAEAGKAGAGSDKGANGDSKALNDKLQVTKESLDSTRRENGELKGRMTDLQSQLDKLQRLIQLKDDQLAKLQADLAAKGKTAAQPTAVVVAPVPAIKAPAVAAPAAKEPVAPAVPAPAPAPEVEAAKPAVSTPPATDFNYSEESAKPAEAVAPAPVEAAKPVAVPAVKPAEPVKPVAVAPAVAPEPQAESFIDGLLANPMLLAIAGGGGLLALLVGLMMLSKRNAQKEAELLEGLHADEAESLDSDLELPESSFDELDTPLDAEVDLDAAPERVTAQTADPLGEADIYIAYGRFNQAAELLQNAINDEPQRSDLRLKLLEVQAELGDRDGFARQESELREIGGVTADVDQIKAKYPSMTTAAVAVGVAAAASNMDAELDAFSLDDLDLDEPAAVAPGQDMDDAFDLSLDDLEAELDSDLAASNVQGSSTDFADLSLDGDFDLADEAVKPAANQELSFDLELDSSVSAEDDFDLADFSLEMETDGQPATAAADEDFLLSLDDEPAAVANDFSELSLNLPADEQVDALDLPADFDLSLAEEAPAELSTDSFAAHLDEVTAELEQLASNLDQPDVMDDLGAPLPDLESAEDLDDDFDFLSGTDESATKLDLARAYIDMGDTEGARDILDEVVAEGSDVQQQEARDLIARLT
ncbi:MAG: FimV/HubP family polar landmark protein [Pseudomonas sp.]|uniref:FimV/HubP family polar landmark protein n=1 Tax=Pseudomonas sp. TaxID=306 RepID=UPI003BB4BA0A